MSVALRYAARSNIGLGRYKNNQDSGFAGPHVLAVCDGMGGHAGGDVASSIAVAHLATLDGESVGSDAPQVLVETIRDAHAAMLERVEANPELAGMGTTVTAILKYGGKLALAHIGDSRAYLLSAETGKFVQVTKDHTFVQWLVDQGSITEEEAAVHPQRSVITRVLGDADASDDIDTSVREAGVGDRWLICSDGLSGPVSAETLGSTLRELDDPAECAERLIDLALKGGGQDNITCVVADILPADDGVSTAPQSVGAASVQPSNASKDSTPAERAHKLISPDPEPEPDATETSATNPWLRRFGLGVVSVVGFALVVLGGLAAYQWNQSQYFVGIADKDVAIFQGLPQDIGPLTMSTVFEKKKIPVDSLSEATKTQLDETISARDLPDARRISVQILKKSQLCVPTNVTPTSTSTTAPSATPGGLDVTPSPTSTSEPGDNGEPTSSPTLIDAPTPTPTPLNYLGEPLPQECDAS